MCHTLGGKAWATARPLQEEDPALMAPGGFKYVLEFSPLFEEEFQFDGPHILQMGGFETTNQIDILNQTNLAWNGAS